MTAVPGLASPEQSLRFTMPFMFILLAHFCVPFRLSIVSFDMGGRSPMLQFWCPNLTLP
jgi:hypothetical protein